MRTVARNQRKTQGCRQAVVGVLFGLGLVVAGPAQAIDVKLTLDEAKKVLDESRAAMAHAGKAANSKDELDKVRKQASATVVVGADPEKDPCGTSAVLFTKRFRLGEFGRKEAAESKAQGHDVRMPDEFIKKLLEMPNLEVGLQFCGDDEYFAEGAQVVIQQGSKNVKAVDMGKASKGRPVSKDGPPYRTNLSARFAYANFDPAAKAKLIITLMDGKMLEVDADFSKVK
ncbi:MAG: hypothetical protein HZB35_02425 [Nitrospirae bacterium]|nr:hypothetical protein [Nitrospirota bacterium]